MGGNLTGAVALCSGDTLEGVHADSDGSEIAVHQ